MVTVELLEEPHAPSPTAAMAITPAITNILVRGLSLVGMGRDTTGST